MLAKMTRYKVYVEALRPRRSFSLPDPEQVLVMPGDTFFGYSFSEHRLGKYFDLWFTNPKSDDPDNFVTFGRVLCIDGNEQGGTYYTKIGTFKVEKICTDASEVGTVASSASACTALGWTPGRRRAFFSLQNREGTLAQSRNGSKRNPTGKTTLPSGRGANSRTTRTGR